MAGFRERGREGEGDGEEERERKGLCNVTSLCSMMIIITEI